MPLPASATLRIASRDKGGTFPAKRRLKQRGSFSSPSTHHVLLAPTESCAVYDGKLQIKASLLKDRENKLKSRKAAQKRRHQALAKVRGRRIQNSEFPPEQTTNRGKVPSLRKTSVPSRRSYEAVMARKAKQHELVLQRKANPRATPVTEQLKQTRIAIDQEITKQQALRNKLSNLRREANALHHLGEERLHRKHNEAIARELEIQIELERERSEQLIEQIVMAKQKMMKSVVPPQDTGRNHDNQRDANRKQSTIAMKAPTHAPRINLTSAYLSDETKGALSSLLGSDEPITDGKNKHEHGRNNRNAKATTHSMEPVLSLEQLAISPLPHVIGEAENIPAEPPMAPPTAPQFHLNSYEETRSDKSMNQTPRKSSIIRDGRWSQSPGYKSANISGGIGSRRRVSFDIVLDDDDDDTESSSDDDR